MTVFTFAVATLEEELATAFVHLEAGAEFGSTGLPVPGLEPLRVEAGTWWYAAPVGQHRADTDETHRLALLHPRYDGFLALHVTARTDLRGVRIVPDATLDPIITAHHLDAPLRRGQRRPIDLELHPGAIPPGGVSGLVAVVDADGADVAPPMRLTLATDASLTCELAGAVDGPWPPAQFEQVVEELLAGRGGPRRLARRMAAVEAGDADPGWSRMPWGRR